VSPVKYELGPYIPDDCVLHNYRILYYDALRH
jgi:hypothetical protein